ncbi:hypothetical protein [Streptomyces marincola]|nr:hypothetical protein [Streptomyces marincola]
MTTLILDLQELEATENPAFDEVQGCCGLGTLLTCPTRTFDW